MSGQTPVYVPLITTTGIDDPVVRLKLHTGVPADTVGNGVKAVVDVAVIVGVPGTGVPVSVTVGVTVDVEVAVTTGVSVAVPTTVCTAVGGIIITPVGGTCAFPHPATKATDTTIATNKMKFFISKPPGFFYFWAITASFFGTFNP
jgi:hypothetical protein